MKKLLTTVCVVIMIMLCGCEFSEEANPDVSTGNSFISVYVDTETGVNYYLYKEGYTGNMIVRLNPDGTPYVSSVK